ncbi:hypothetical protein [Pseudoxanthomonas mexicana]|uniref:hypothetical protein n=1 Tax=Pseudoxanthomonas mexicana TaxID=128785 RepID=UPI00398B2BA5
MALLAGALIAGMALAQDPPMLDDFDDDALVEALTCRTAPQRLPALLPRLRHERPADFTQAERQYSLPLLDLYRLDAPVQAWGQTSDGIVIADNRVLMVIEGDADAVARQLDEYLQQSSASPLAGALDEMHALIVYPGDVPGLQGRVLLGCEYRFADLRLLDDDALLPHSHPITSR